MIHQTLSAKAQVDALLDYYLEKERYEAYEHLLESIEEAAARIETAPSSGAPYPSTYSGISRWKFGWIKVHRYWFGWSTVRGFPVVTNVFFDASARWKSGRVKADEGDLEPL